MMERFHFAQSENLAQTLEGQIEMPFIDAKSENGPFNFTTCSFPRYHASKPLTLARYRNNRH